MPFPISHSLSDLELFSMPNLQKLAATLNGGDYYISKSAQKSNSAFYEDSATPLPTDLREILQGHPDTQFKALLKRPENHSIEFRELLDVVLNEIYSFAAIDPSDVVRAESGIFVTGSNAITPLHFDPETAFFFQISGRKIYHIYPPSIVEEEELERHYKKGDISIGEIDHRPDSEPHELTFELAAGRGLHQPAESAHWVETADQYSVSYAVGFETRQMRARGRVYAFNHLKRKIGFSPQAHGQDAKRDDRIAALMSVGQPLLKRLMRAAYLMRRTLSFGTQKG